MEVLTSLDVWGWIYFVFVLIGASLVHGTLGMGFPLILTALLALIMDVKDAVLISLIPSAAINVICLLQGYRWQDLLRKFLALSLLAGAGSAWGTEILLTAPPDPIKLLLVLSISFYLLMDRLKTRRIKWIKERPVVAWIAFGLLAGVVGGVTNAMGPILAIYFIEAQFGTDETVQGLNLCFLVGKLAQIFVFTTEGQGFELTALPWLACITLVVLAVLFSGIRIRQQFDVATYHQTLKLSLGIIAAVLLVQVVFNLI